MFLSLPEGVYDCHIHIGSFPTLNITFTPRQLKRVMNKYGIVGALVFSGPQMPHQFTEQILRTSKKNNKIFTLLRGKPQDYKNPQYIKYMEKQLKKERVVGVKINPSTERYKITSEQYSDVLTLLDEYEGILLVHCGRWVEMSGWDKVLVVANEYKNIKVIMAHMGGTHPNLSFPAIEAIKKTKNVYMDTSQTRQPTVLQRGIETLGASRILFGSDMPWGSYLQNLIGVFELGLPKSDLNKILRENFMELVKEK